MPLPAWKEVWLRTIALQGRTEADAYEGEAARWKQAHEEYENCTKRGGYDTHGHFNPGGPYQFDA